MTKKTSILTQFKSEAYSQFEGSDRFFNYCWRKLLQYERDGGFCDGGLDQTTVNEVLEQFASEAVNNSRSTFYIYGL